MRESKSYASLHAVHLAETDCEYTKGVAENCPPLATLCPFAIRNRQGSKYLYSHLTLPPQEGERRMSREA